MRWYGNFSLRLCVHIRTKWMAWHLLIHTASINKLGHIQSAERIQGIERRMQICRLHLWRRLVEFMSISVGSIFSHYPQQHFIENTIFGTIDENWTFWSDPLNWAQNHLCDVKLHVKIKINNEFRCVSVNIAVRRMTSMSTRMTIRASRALLSVCCHVVLTTICISICIF